MHDKTVRRRRAVLAVLVVLSLILLTAYFGESPDGRLHSVQQDFLTVISPIQDGANKALKPVRNLIGWVGDTLHAKSQRNDLLKENERLRKELIDHQANERSYRELAALYHLENTLSIKEYRPVTATVITSLTNIWYSTVNIDEGSSAGIRINDAVINGEGLVGKVTQVASDAAVVSLVTDSTVAVSAEIEATGATGLIAPKVGDTNDLVLQYLPTGSPVSAREYVVTSGTISTKGESLFPRGIPIGQVTSTADEGPYEDVNVRPIVDLHTLNIVRVLTDVRGSRAATLDRVASTLGLERTSQPSTAVTGPAPGQLASTGAGG